MSQFYIHIGAPKTGSTFLQKLLTNNYEALRDLGLLYPRSINRGYGHHDLAFLAAGGYPEWATGQDKSLSELMLALAEEVSGYDGSILLSSENFFIYPEPDRLMEQLESYDVLRGREVKIVVYVRRQEDALESWYNQIVKAQGYTRSPHDCIDEYFDLWDYSAQLGKWEAVFGRGNIIVRPYESKAFLNASLQADFLNILELDSGSIPATDDRTNARVNRDIVEFQRLINELPLETAKKRMFHKELIRLTELAANSDVFADCPVYDSEMRAHIRGRYHAGNMKLVERYPALESMLSGSDKQDIGKEGAYRGLSNEAIIKIVGWLLISRDSVGR